MVQDGGFADVTKTAKEAQICLSFYGSLQASAGLRACRYESLAFILRMSKSCMAVTPIMGSVSAPAVHNIQRAAHE